MLDALGVQEELDVVPPPNGSSSCKAGRWEMMSRIQDSAVSEGPDGGWGQRTENLPAREGLRGVPPARGAQAEETAWAKAGRCE